MQSLFSFKTRVGADSVWVFQIQISALTCPCPNPDRDPRRRQRPGFLEDEVNEKLLLEVIFISVGGGALVFF